MRIIIVDDEAVALHIFLDEIMRRGDVEYKFFKDDVKEIEEYVAVKHVDAAFLDIKMPRVDGVVLAKKLIELSPSIKIVFITGLDVGENDLPENICANTLGFIYKPYDREVLYKYLNLISDVAMKMSVTMFGSFDCFINGERVEFTTNKSKELFAILLLYGGRNLTMADAISHMWPDHDPEKAKILYRDAVWRLRKTLQKINFECVNFSRGMLKLNRENISCDLWDYLDGKRQGYRDDLLKNYDWSVNYVGMLGDKEE